MKSVRTSCFVVVVLFLGAYPAQGMVEFKDGQTHNISSTINDDVWVDWQTPDMHTTVNLLFGGCINYPYSLRGFEHSQINISGGNIEESLYVWDNSLATISGGLISNQLHAYNNSRIIMSGGRVGGQLMAFGNGQISVAGGACPYVGADDYGQINISGEWQVVGNQCIIARDYGSITLSGAGIPLTDTKLISTGSSCITILGSDFYTQSAYGDWYPFHYGYGEITGPTSGSLDGKLLNGVSISCDFEVYGDAKIILIPEPATLLLLSLGGLILRRKSPE
jgi:hypothetical protein